ncbi:MAG: restriction endonuclease [Quadrisphaera sp.]
MTGANLSDHDFEALCRDLMSLQLGEAVEAFATGKDGGIDLRFRSATTNIIGQAKHYLRSSYGSLLRSIAKEKAKLDALDAPPNRYIFYTTHPLSPQRKDEILAAARPYILATGDIHGPDDIDGLIAQYPDIEARHYKLWLASANVLHRILGNATLSRSQLRTQEILDKSRLFVPHSQIAAAEEILKKESCLIFPGHPGLARQPWPRC